MRTMMASDLTVSLEPHLAQSLKSLLPFLPAELCSILMGELLSPEIHYSLLTQISRWARTDTGQARLRAAQLDPRNYDNMVSLLAGTRTAPSSKPPPDAPSGSESAESRARRELNDRKAIVAILNGLLTIGCCGAAAWWAADKSGWRDEWKVLLSLMVATSVGVSEIVLFLIWQSRSSSSSVRRPYQRPPALKSKTIMHHKKSDDNGTNIQPTFSRQDTGLVAEDVNTHLRHRTIHAEEG